MIWIAYNILFSIGYFLMMPHFLLRMCRRGGYRKDFLQRAGMYSPETRKRLRERSRVWVHAVSVGEIFVALRLMKEIRLKEPETSFVLTTTTSTGHAMAERELHADDVLLYFPSDFPFVVNRALDALEPAALVLVESEIWPNLIRKAHGRGIPVMLVNGRISDSSYRGYRWCRAFFRRALRCIDLLMVQSDLDMQRLVDVGAPADRVHVLGTVKYDVALSEMPGSEAAEEALASAGIDPANTIILGGSTWPGEERALLEIYGRLAKKSSLLKLVLVPRHAERGNEIANEIGKQGLSFRRRSEALSGRGKAPQEPPDVLLADTTGELRSFYACASIVFVGKSLCSHGGQNMIEPALAGKAVIVGPHTENFPVVVSDFLERDALVRVRDEQELADAIERLLANPALRDAYGTRAREVVIAKAGVVQKNVRMILDLLASQDHAAPDNSGKDQGIVAEEHQ